MNSLSSSESSTQHTHNSDTKSITNYTRYDYARSFDVAVGPEKKLFTLCHDFFTERSGFFKAARSSRWLGQPETPTDLSYHDPEDFSNYLELIYKGEGVYVTDELKRQCGQDLSGDEWNAFRAQVDSNYEASIKLYILADKLEDLKSANMIMDDMICLSDETGMLPPMPQMHVIYDSTPQRGPLRRMLRYSTIYEVHKDYFDDSKKGDHPEELLLDIAREHLKIKHSHKKGKTISNFYTKSLKDFSKRRYHQHNDKNPKCAKVE